LQLARTPDEAARFQRLAAQRGWPADYLQHVDAARASHLAGAKVAGEGLFFPQAGWINPPSLVQAQLDQAADHLTARFGVHVDALVYENGLWIAQDGNGKQIGAAPVVVLANAADAKRLAPTLQLASDERVVTTLPASTALSVNMVVCCGGYLTPVHDGLACIGSSPVGDDASRANLALLDQMLPDASAAMKHASLGSRQCARPGTPDRLPIVGPIADVARWQAKHAGSLHLAPRQSGLFALTGFGARGLVWQGLMAELLASQICGEPLPVERDLVLAVDPARFLARAGQRYDAASQAQDASD
jgi:tRNA 5-methylaminomethyl-2-thiouridine biosynthesis bifunctional protein